jgi:hypothetical protein
MSIVLKAGRGIQEEY